jgi:hypothetical protein
MQYMLMICGDESTPDLEERSERADDEMDPRTVAWAEEMDRRGVRKLGSRLRPTSTATTVRVRDGESLLSDGPFAETKEQILGFDLIECDDIEEAIVVAAKHPWAGVGSIEVRPLWPT